MLKRFFELVLIFQLYIRRSKTFSFVYKRPKMKHNYADIESLTLINEYRWYYRLCNYAKKEDNSNRNGPCNR